MSEELQIKMYSLTLDCKDPQTLADFYAKLLGWEVVFFNEEFACVGPSGIKQGGYPGITFQQNPNYLPPVWSEKKKEQQQMAHLDFVVSNLKKAVEHAIKCGAKLAEDQFSDGWKVMFDPAGHPFCLVEMKAIIESEHFALL